ncbi:MAG: O-antigen ligase family protein [Blastocatellia bacterium]
MTKINPLTTTASVDLAPALAPTRDRTSVRANLSFYLLLGVVAATAIPYGTVAPLREAIFEITVYLLAMSWIWQLVQRGESLLQHRTLTIPVLALVAFALVQTLPLWTATSPAAHAVASAGNVNTISADPFETRRFVLKLVALLLAGVLLRAYVQRTPKNLSTLVHLVIGIGVVSALFALLRHVWQQEGTSFVLPLLQARVGYGQFINHNHFAFLMEMTGGLLCGLIVSREMSRARVLYYLLAGLVIWSALVLSNSRGGIFSMLGQLCFLVALWPQLLLRTTWSRSFVPPAGETAPRAVARLLFLRAGLTAFLLVVLVVGVIWVGGNSLINRFDELPREIKATGDLDPRLRVRRVEMWAATWQLIKASPWGGNGFGGYEPAITEYYDASGNWTLRQAHNDYLELLASGGLISALLVLWLVVAVLHEAHKQLGARASFRRAACRGALIGLCGIAFHSIVDFGLHLTINALLCTALIVIATVDMEDEPIASLVPKEELGEPEMEPIGSLPKGSANVPFA